MAIDEARHQRAALAIDDAGFRRLDLLRGDFTNRVSLDQHRDAAFKCVSVWIEQAGILEQNLRHRQPPVIRSRQ